jgi:hypothetical protein
MKMRVIATALLIMVLSAGISADVNAAPWRHHERGWSAPHVGISVYTPPVAIGGYYGGGNYERRNCRPHNYYAPRYGYERHYGGYRHCR